MRSKHLGILIIGSTLFSAAQGFPADDQPRIQTAPAEEVTGPREPRRMPEVLASPTPETDGNRPQPVVDGRGPNQIVKNFFDELQADRVEAAYATLSGQMALADRGEEGRMLRDQTQRALDEYGPIRGYELIAEVKAGDDLIRRTYLLHGEVLPLRWRFYFYRTTSGWNLVDLRVDDSLIEIFDEVSGTGP